MTTARKNGVIVFAAVTAAVCLGGVTTYLLDMPPFQRAGEIGAKSVCPSLGEPKKVVPALKQTLSMESKYSFSEDSQGGGVEDSGYYTSTCFAWGETDDRLLLSARVEMMRDEPSEKKWARGEISDRQNDGEGDLESFDAGVTGVTSPSKSAILVPCVAAGRIPGGPYSLGVIVDLVKRRSSSDAKVRQSLIDLSLSTARFAHEKAKCQLPFHGRR